jgi:hypothetical protein
MNHAGREKYHFHVKAKNPFENKICYSLGEEQTFFQML